MSPAGRIWMMMLRRVRAFRKDDGAQVLLLSGIMVFVAVLFAIMTINTSEAIYRRIIAQNAVDAAADSAALWQARGLNLLQHLNNIHFVGNGIAAVAYTIACICSYIPYTAAVCIPITQAIDKVQAVFAIVIEGFQKAITFAFPILAFLNANEMARSSNADRLGKPLLEYVEDMGTDLGFDMPSFAGTPAGDFLQKVPLYAFPLNPMALSLGVEAKTGRLPPWYMPPCPIAGTDGWKNGYTMEGDQYYCGHPGYMTWIAGKKRKDELLGLGDLVWFNPSGASVDAETMYVDTVTRSGLSKAQKLHIPPFLAFASSQVEGDAVVPFGLDKANAEGHIIPVHIPFVDVSGKWIGIFH